MDEQDESGADPVARLAAEIRRQVTSDLRSDLGDLRKGLVELARGINEVRESVEGARQAAATDLSNALVTVVDHLEAVVVATGWAVADRIQGEEADVEAGQADPA